jgi:cation diffusion facilitator family transporter
VFEWSRWYSRVMSDCACHVEVSAASQRPVLWIALGLNAAMAVIETVAGIYADSAGLLADGIDMLSDASAYGIALAAIGRSPLFKARAATLSGGLLFVLGLGMLFEVIRRIIEGSDPVSLWMIGIAALSLGVNVVVLRLLKPFRTGEVHLRAAWIFTRADVIASFGVLVSGVVVALSGVPYADLVVGAAIGLYVMREAIEILREAREAGVHR